MSDPIQKAAQQLEAVVLRAMLNESGAFKLGKAAGSHIASGMFVDAVADAVASAGGLGLSDAIVNSMTPAAPAGATPTQGLPHRAAPGVDLAALLIDGPAHQTSGFGSRIDPITKARRDHHGVDLAAKAGSAIKAATDGVVIAAGERGGYGLAIEVQAADGTRTLYAHAREITVEKGQRVRAGQQLGEVGSTGRSTGPHLHFEVRRGKTAINPSQALKTYTERVETPSEAPQTLGGHRG